MHLCPLRDRVRKQRRRFRDSNLDVGKQLVPGCFDKEVRPCNRLQTDFFVQVSNLRADRTLQIGASALHFWCLSGFTALRLGRKDIACSAPGSLPGPSCTRRSGCAEGQGRLRLTPGRPGLLPGDGR